MRHLTTILVSIMAAASIALTGCSHENPKEAVIQKHIVGKWKTSIFDGKAVRQKEDGTQYVARFEMRKVK